MEEETPFIIKNEKYSLDIILKYQTPNGISKKGITIYKKNCEINFLNEESLNKAENNKEKENNIIYSYANIGFISIYDVICFLYLSKDDIILLNNNVKDEDEEYLYYKVKNVHYIIMNELEIDDEENFNKNFEQFKIFFIHENLYFSFSKYGNNILNHHIYSSNNYFYNEKYITLFKQSNTIQFITPLNRGFYKYFIIKDNKSKDNNKETIDFIEIIIQITNKINKNEKDEITIEDVINTKQCFQEIKIDIFSNIINKKVNYIFYSFYGKSCSNIDFLFSLINNTKEIKNGLLLTVFDYAYDKEIKKLNLLQYKNSLKSSIKNEKIKDLFEIEISNDGKKNNIKKFVFENIDKIKSVFENNDNDLLIISGTNDSSIFNLSQEIIESIIYLFFDKYINKDNNYNDILIYKTKSNINNFFNIIDELNGKRTMKLFKLKFPKIHYVTQNYIHENISNIKKKELIIKKGKINFNIFILTYNVCGMSIENINEINFTELLFPINAVKYYDSKNNNYPLFYCIGLEEVINLNAKNVIIGGEKKKYKLWEEKINLELKSKDNYVLLLKTSLVGILFFIFVKAEEISKIKNIKTSKIKSGFYGQFGNKGSCFVEFEYENKKYGFNSGHLAAGEKIKNNNERKNCLINILNHQSDKSDKDANEFYKNDFYFILGDLNFRVQNNIKIIHNWLFDLKFEGKQNSKNRCEESANDADYENKSDKNKNNIESIKEKEDDETSENIFYQIDEKIFMKYFGDDYWKFDQLNIFKKELIKYNIKESDIFFNPTYKYAKKTNNYNLLKREPSWTDRILFKENKFIRSILYDRINIHYSDHMPIFSLFEINY